jgi:hypothetical protein
MSLRSDDERSVALALEPGGSISGRVAFISQGQASAGDPAGIRISLSPTSRANAPVVSSGSFLMRRDVAVRADGTFSIRGLGPGAYGLRVELPADLEARGWWPRSAIVDGRDLLDLDPELTTSRDLDDVIVTIADSHTELSGVLHTAAGGTASDYFMVVFSADPRNWRALSRRTQVARPATDGRFEIHDLPAGEYFLGAVTTIDADELLTPAFFEQLVAVSTRVTLGENERRRQDVRLAR